MTELKRALVDIVAEHDPLSGRATAEHLVDRLLSRLAQGDAAVIEAMARAAWNNSFPDMRWETRSDKTRSMWRGEVRAALAAGMKEVMK